MGHIFDFSDAKKTEALLVDPECQAIADRLIQLTAAMLKPLPGKSLLDIGCGTGMILQAFRAKNLQVTGVDPSPYMLDFAAARLTHKADLHRAVAEDLPFDDNSFNYACLFHTLEFVENPKAAIAESFRVAKDRVFLGIVNKYAFKSPLKPIFADTVYDHAQFFSIWEIKKLIRQLVGDVPLIWQAGCHLPLSADRKLPWVGRSNLMKNCPFSPFLGIAVDLVPRYRTRPMALKIRSKRNTIADLKTI